MSWRESAYLEYYGSVILSSSPCSIEFKNEETTDFILCISTLQITINCGTELEFHEHYVKSYFTPEASNIKIFEENISRTYKYTFFIMSINYYQRLI
jgi:hypothetical protein